MTVLWRVMDEKWKRTGLILVADESEILFKTLQSRRSVIVSK
jgi:hypothetical protein